MSPNEKRSRVNGFTLTEMIVVIAIIGILLGILMPSMMNYYRSSRVKAANADAKMVYNAAQTEVMRYINIDRAEPSAAAKSGFSGTTVISYDPTNGITVSKNLSNTPVAANVTAAHRTIVQNVNRTVSGADLVCWSICVNNYIVQASASAQNSSSNYVGFYSANKQSADLDDIAGDYGAGSPLPTYMTTLKNLALHY